MANPTTIECLKYLHAKGETEAERQKFFDTAPYVLKAQIISAQRNLKQPEVTFIVKSRNETIEQCREREKIHLKEEIDIILETCIHSMYSKEVKNLILNILRELPPHQQNIESVNERAGDLFKELTTESLIVESKKLAKEIDLHGNVNEMRAQMDSFLNQHVADKLEVLKSKSQYIYSELMKSAV